MRSLVDEAEEFAAAAHSGQLRKYTGAPYIEHPTAVAALVARVTDDPEIIAAAYLHDVLEDTSVTFKQLLAHFGWRVASMVAALTNEPSFDGGPNRAARKAADRERLKFASSASHTIKLADLIDNTKSIVEHDPKFARTYLQEKRDLLAVLTRGDSRLRRLARRQLHRAAAQRHRQG